MIGHKLVVVVACFFALSACSKSPTPEELAVLEALRKERSSLGAELEALEQERSKYAGGSILSLLTVRRETLLVTDALLQQRIQALEGGAPVTLHVPASTPDLAAATALEPEIERLRGEISKAEQEASQYSGGLIRLSKLSTAATYEHALAMVRLRQVIARHGLALPPISAGDAVASEGDQNVLAASDADHSESTQVEDSSLADEILAVEIKRKRFNEGMSSSISFDLEFQAVGLDKPARAIKGILKLNDLFDETKMQIRWTIDEPLSPLGRVAENGSGFSFNRFMEDHLWVRSTAVGDMRASFSVESILYEDGTRRDF